MDKNYQKYVVYKIDCKNCDSTYIGHTERFIKTRIQEHKDSVTQFSKNHNVVPQHIITNNYDHNFDWTNFKILDVERNTRKRKIAESLFIKNTKNTINLQTDTKNVDSIYNTLLD